MTLVIGKVISNIVSTRKHEALRGCKLLVIKEAYDDNGVYFVAADEIGAGIGEYVLVSQGEVTKYALDREAPVDAVVVGIIDEEPSIDD